MNIEDVFAVDDPQEPGGSWPIEQGVITSVSPLQADCSGTPENVTAMNGYTPVKGDLAVMLRGRGVTIVIGRTAVDQAPPVAIPAVLTGSDPFPAGQTFSWKDGRAFEYQSSVRQGALDSTGAWSGAWFYQGAPGAALAGATVTGAAVKVTRASGGTPGSQPINLYLSSTGQWPVVDLVPPMTVGSVVTQALAPGETQWITLPPSVGQALVDTDAGLMITGSSPMVLLEGIDTDPESGLLRIDWTR